MVAMDLITAVIKPQVFVIQVSTIKEIEGLFIVVVRQLVTFFLTYLLSDLSVNLIVDQL